jgi:hypothetical protein
MKLEREADNDFEGPVDKYGQPKVDNNALDIEVRFTKEGPTQYRFFWDGPHGAVCGAWRNSREHAFHEGETYLATGKTYG